MRDPWFPALTLFVVLLGVWLGILGPPPKSANWLYDWQTLIAAAVAICAAFIAHRNTSRVIENNRAAEIRQRRRKFVATRALFPLALTDICAHGSRAMVGLEDLTRKTLGAGSGRQLPIGEAAALNIQPLSERAIDAIAQMIEFADDDIDLALLEQLAAWMQVWDARIRGMVTENTVHRQTIHHASLHARMLDTAAMYAGAEAFFEYARRRTNTIPTELNWDQVSNALGALNITSWNHPELWTMLDTRKRSTTGPFQNIPGTRAPF